MARLNTNIAMMFLIAAGRAFHSRGPATQKALSPNSVLVARGLSNSLVIADRDRPLPGSVEILVVVSAMKNGLVTSYTAFISRQRL